MHALGQVKIISTTMIKETLRNQRESRNENFEKTELTFLLKYKQPITVVSLGR